MPEPVPEGLVAGLDLPAESVLVDASRVEISGWGMQAGRPVLATAVTLTGPGWSVTKLAERYERPDVAAVFDYPENERGALGWTAVFDLADLEEDCPLVAYVTVWGTAASAPLALPAREFRALARPRRAGSADAHAGIQAALELPDGGELGLPRDLLRIRGWAFVRGSSIEEVEVVIAGRSIGLARLGLHRPDVFEQAGLSEALLCGFEHHVDLADLPGSVDSVTVGAFVRAGGETLRLGDQVVSLAPAKRLVDGRPARRAQVLAARTRRMLARVPGGALREEPAADGQLDLLVVTHDLGYGGAQLWLSELLDKAGAGRAFPCTVLSRAPGPLTEVLERAGIGVHVRDEYSMRDAEMYEAQVCELALWSRLLGHNAVLVNTMGAFLGADLAARLGLPCVWAVHESWSPEEYWRLNFDPAAVDRRVVAVARQVLATTGAVVFETEATKRLYDGSFAQGAGVVVPYGIDVAAVDEFAERVTKAAARRLLKLPAAARVVLMLGTIEPRKAQSVLTQAFERVTELHPDAHLVLVGDQATPYSNALRRYIELGSVRDRVHMVPVVKDVYPWYRAADLFVSASDIESMPRSVLEAMAFGVPVLATDIYGLPELIEHGKNGWLFGPRSVGEAAGALHEALSADPETAGSIGSAGSDVVRARHDSLGYAHEIHGLLLAMTRDATSSASDLLALVRSRGRS